MLLPRQTVYSPDVAMLVNAITCTHATDPKIFGFVEVPALLQLLYVLTVVELVENSKVWNCPELTIFSKL